MTLRGVLSDDEYAQMLDASEAVLARREPYVGVVDLRELRRAPDARQRRLIASRAREMDKKYGEASLCSIMVVNSPLMRGALTAVEWLRGREQRDLWVATMEEAMDCALDVLTKRGLG